MSDVLHISTAESNDGELAAMVSFAIAFPNGFMALVDTYDVKRYIICFFCFQNNLSDQYCYQNNFQWKIFKNSFISFGKFSIKKLFFFHSFDTKYGLKIHSNPKKTRYFVERRFSVQKSYNHRHERENGKLLDLNHNCVDNDINYPYIKRVGNSLR